MINDDCSICFVELPFWWTLKKEGEIRNRVGHVRGQKSLTANTIGQNASYGKISADYFNSCSYDCR